MSKEVSSPYLASGLKLIQRGGYWHIRGTRDGERIRATTGTGDLREAKLALDDLVRELDSGWRRGQDDETVSWKTIANTTCRRQRSSATARGIPFSVTPSDVFISMEASNFRCAVSGIAFSRQYPTDGVPDPWGASIDRIENRHGYQPDNIRIVCLAANLAMNRWGFDTLLRLSRSVVRSTENIAAESAKTEHTDVTAFPALVA